ncbi:MAG TPA: LexA family transcriptional regulator [Planctomycetota bacterium]|nr:LexA family transcriptional regulator [Planctomycetota bacterium]
MNAGLKIRILRMQGKLSQGELAEKIGLTQAVMSRIEGGKREPTVKELQQIAAIFNVQPAFFLAEDTTLNNLDAMYKRGDLGRMAERKSNVGELTEACVRVPVFDIEGGYTIAFDDGGYPVGHAGKYQLLSPAEAANENFFGCDLHGDSMQQQGEPSFREGDRLFFDPAGEVKHGALAFVRTSEGTATFKQVFFDAASTARLHPLNSRYPDIMLQRRDVVAMWPLVFRIQRF